MDAAKLASYSTALLGMATVMGALIVPQLANRLGRRLTLGIFYTIMTGFYLGRIRSRVLPGNWRHQPFHGVRWVLAWVGRIASCIHSGYRSSTEQSVTPVRSRLPPMLDVLPLRVSLFW